jgi:hypothetical protein
MKLTQLLRSLKERSRKERLMALLDKSTLRIRTVISDTWKRVYHQERVCTSKIMN